MVLLSSWRFEYPGSSRDIPFQSMDLQSLPVPFIYLGGALSLETKLVIRNFSISTLLFTNEFANLH